MDLRDGFVGTIGETPLIRLRLASEATGCEILGKAEFLNPGGSVKDRAALAIVEDAERSGHLRPGGVVVEGTAGNTGIGLALVGNARGYRTVIVIPETQSREKKEFLRLIGAEVREVPAVPYKNPGNYVHVSQRLAEELAKTEPNGAIWANQFDNVANRDGHYRTTGREIWTQTDGKVDGLSVPVERWPASPPPCANGTPKWLSDWPIHPVRLFTASTAPVNSRPKAPPSRRGSDKAASPPIWRGCGSIVPISFRTRNPCLLCSTY
jgi:hypothetical protein